MSSIVNFFCCGKEAKENEVVINMNQRRRSHSLQNNRTAHINRSVGKNPRADSGQKQSNNVTTMATTWTKSSQQKQLKQRESESKSLIEYSYQEKSHSFIHLTPSKMNSPPRNGNGRSPNFNQFVNYNQLNKQSYDLAPIQNIDIIAQPVVRTAPRLLVERRLRKAKEKEGISVVTTGREQKRWSTNKKQPFVVTVLEPIEQRLSMPSCSESQINDMNLLSSRSVLQNRYDSGQRFQESPVSQKYRSCVFGRESNQAELLSRGASEKFMAFQRKSSEEHQKLILSKLKIDIEIYQKQLSSLQDEQRLLKEQSKFSRRLYQQNITKLEQTKRQLRQNLDKYEKSMKEMREMVQIRMSHSIHREPQIQQRKGD